MMLVYKVFLILCLYTSITAYQISHQRNLGIISLADLHSIVQQNTNSRFLEENSQQQAAFVIKLYGNATLGYYYANLYIGTPLQRQSVIVDTGSTVTTFPCSECGKNDCGKHQDESFNIQKSETSKIYNCSAKDNLGRYQCSCEKKTDRCYFGVSYSEGSSLRGFLLQDQVAIAKVKSNETSYIKIPLVFGCTTNEQNLFRTQYADGIMGLGINSNSSSQMPNIVDYAKNSDKIKNLVFSLCYGLDLGYMSLGGFNYNKHQSNSQIQTISISRSAVQYNIRVHSLMINGESTGLTLTDFDFAQGTFLDSGTTIVYAHWKVYSTIMNGFNGYCKQDKEKRCLGLEGDLTLTKCIKLKGDLNQALESFPDLEFTFDDNVTYKWPPRYYFYEDTPGNYCVGIENIDGRVILGGLFMRGREFLFDKEKNTIQFIDANCTAEDDIEDGYFEEKQWNSNFKQNAPISNKVSNKFKQFLSYILIVALSSYLLYWLFVKITKKEQQHQEINREDGIQLNDQMEKQNSSVEDGKQQRIMNHNLYQIEDAEYQGSIGSDVYDDIQNFNYVVSGEDVFDSVNSIHRNTEKR